MQLVLNCVHQLSSQSLKIVSRLPVSWISRGPWGLGGGGTPINRAYRDDLLDRVWFFDFFCHRQGIHLRVCERPIPVSCRRQGVGVEQF